MSMGKGIPMKSFIVRCVAMAGVALVAASLGAQETTHTLTDLNQAGEWTSYAWSKAPNTVAVVPEFPEALKGLGEPGALQVKVTWPGGEGFAFSTVVPSAPAALTIPYRVSKASLWIKGSGTGHYVELHFLANGQEKSAEGKEYKLGLGQMTYDTWQKCEAVIPADWPQPLTVKSIAMHNWSVPMAGEATCHFTRLEVTGDPGQPLP